MARIDSAPWSQAHGSVEVGLRTGTESCFPARFALRGPAIQAHPLQPPFDRFLQEHPDMFEHVRVLGGPVCYALRAGQAGHHQPIPGFEDLAQAWMQKIQASFSFSSVRAGDGLALGGFTFFDLPGLTNHF